MNVIQILHECCTETEIHKTASSPRAWNILKEYCLFYIKKNLAMMIRNNNAGLFEIDIESLKGMIENCFMYITDSVSDLETIL